MWLEPRLGPFWVQFACSPSKNMHVRLIGDSELSLGVSVSSHGCLSRLSLCGPAMDWRSVQGVPCLSPNDSWDRLQPPRDPDLDQVGMENEWMATKPFHWPFHYKLLLKSALQMLRICTVC